MFKAFPVKIQAGFFFFGTNRQAILKFIKKCRGPKIAKKTLEKMNRILKFILSDFKTYYKVTIIKIYGIVKKDK